MELNFPSEAFFLCTYKITPKQLLKIGGTKVFTKVNFLSEDSLTS